MGKNFKIKQFWPIIRNHISCVCMLFLLTALLFPNYIGDKFLSGVHTTVCMIIYFFVVYSGAYEVSKKDIKSYTNQKAYWYRGLILPIGLTVIGVFLLVLYLITWKFMTVDGVILGTYGYINNFLFVMWSFVYNGILGLVGGKISVIGIVVLFVYPFIPSFVGYFLGYKGFDMANLFHKLVYSNKDTEDKK